MVSNNNANRSHNPMAEYLLKIQLIINNIEFKNKKEARKYETLESKTKGEAYVRAMLKTDIFESYDYEPKRVYQVLSSYNMNDDRIFYLMKNPQMIPQPIKDVLINEAREKLIAQYVETNPYYSKLTGKPFKGNNELKPDEELLIPDGFYELYKNDSMITRNQPIHEMPTKYQELFMNSNYYSKMKSEHPECEYLNYIGSNSIPIHVSRPASDGAILRINTNKLSTHHPIFGNVKVTSDVIHRYVNSYNETREYVFNTLRGDFDSIYPNYDEFIRFLTIYLSIGNTLNEFMHQSTSMIHMNNITADNFFMLYGLPSIISEGANMIEFLKKFRMILMDKGTNVVYRVKDLIGYNYTDIYTLIMVKQQVFESGKPIYTYDDDGNRIPKQEIVFRRLGTTDDNTSYFKYRDSDKSYTVDEITSGDPRWWNTPEVEQMLQEMNYTLSNSKYIQLSTHISMTDIWWQCVILLRGLLDRKQETQFSNITVNYNLNGTSEISVFEAVLILVILMNWHLRDFNGRAMNGNMYLPNSDNGLCLDLLFNGLNDDGSPKDLTLGMPYKLSSFDFHVRENKKEFYESLSNMEYIEPDIFIPMLDTVLNRESINIGEVMMNEVKEIYSYLETKLRTTKTIRQYRQVTTVYQNLFLVDPVRNDWYDESTFDTDSVLIEEYNITSSDLNSLRSFYYYTSGTPDCVIIYNGEEYNIYMHYILNYNVNEILINDIYPFRDSLFVEAFIKYVHDNYVSNALLTSGISSGIKNNYVNIICDKVQLDVGNTNDGPKTFESLLFRHNSQLYHYVMTLKDSAENIILLIRAIVKSLESYTNSSLSGLECKVVGIDDYMKTLKEVISYFKSYMVDFTKDEFIYIFDGLFDFGGNSNMLRLHDEITSADINILSKDSLVLHDVSHGDICKKMKDDNTMYLRDEAIFKLETTYQNLLNTKYEIWYDDGKRITQTPFDNLTNETKVIANIISYTKNNLLAYKIIINSKNTDIIPPDNYYGNSK